MPRPLHRPARNADLLLAWLIVAVGLLCPVKSALAQEPPALLSGTMSELQLEIWINGHTANTIAPVTQHAGGGLSMTRAAFDDLGVVLPNSGAPDAAVRLDAIPGLTYRFDQPRQILELSVPESMRLAKTYDGEVKRPVAQAARADYGALLNYSLYSSAQQGNKTQSLSRGYAGFNGVNASLDGRMIMPFGTLTQTGLVGTIPAPTYSGLQQQSDFVSRRFSTTYEMVDPGSLHTYRFGDAISGGLSWTQPIRFAGVQVQRNFTARPDIVTQALPSFSGSAAAPSTVDVYVNNIKTYSQQVGAGPFQLANVPSASGQGEARIVVRDASGREVETKQAFYNAPTLLKPGLYEYSADGGIPRYNYGVISNDYGTSTPVGTVSLRAGITDWLTAEAHAEGGLGLANGGAGAVMNVFDKAIVSTAVSASTRGRDTGLQLYGSLDTHVGPVGIHLASTRAVGNYTDLALASARLRPSTAYEVIGNTPAAVKARFGADYRPYLSRDQASISLPLPFDNSGISATYIRSEPAAGVTDQVVSMTYSRPLMWNATLFATAYANLDNTDSAGFYIGASMPLGDVNLSTSVSRSALGLTAAADASKPVGTEPGSWGWRVRDSEGGFANRQGALQYRSAQGLLEATVSQDDGGVSQTASMSGSIVTMGGSVHFADTISDGFAVVNAGTPGVRVLSENRFVGETDENGQLLVPNLRSNQTNQLAIDPTNLSISAEVDKPSQQVVPAHKSGVYADFKVKREGSSAIVIFKSASGAFIEAGTTGKLEGSDEPILVGFDGEAFIRNLSASNTAVLKLDRGTCRAPFEFRGKADTQVVVGPVTCQ
jgi:outer membrane usher protein